MAEKHFRSLAALYRSEEADPELAGEGFSPTFVPGEGPVGAPLMLVGEQPGDQEDLARRPFVGPAGRLLDRCLGEVGVERSQVYLTNAVKRFKFTQRGKRRLHETPNAGDIARYRWWLKEEVRLVGPRVVVALGRSALRALERTPRTAPHGTVLPWEGRALLATIHPSYLLRLRDASRREEERARFLADLHAAAAAVAAA